MRYSDELIHFVVMDTRQGRTPAEIARRARGEFTMKVTAREVRGIIASQSINRSGDVVQRDVSAAVSTAN